LFKKHDLEKRLCVVLNHRHFDLEPGEKLVERGYIATPWLLDGAPEYIKNRIIGRTWTVIDKDILPYEYMYCEEPVEEPLQLTSDFTHELYALLDSHGLVDQLGKYEFSNH
jgi:hypothetical protein